MLLVVAAVVAGLPGQAAAASAAAAARTEPAAAEITGPPSSPRDKAWWMAFDDAGLNLLVRRAIERERGLATMVQAAPDHAGQEVDRAVVAAYLGARVLSARWLALQGVLVATERRDRLVDTTSGLAAQDLETARAGLRSRRAQIIQWQAGLAAQRVHPLAVLALRCGYDSTDLADMLAPVMGQATVPVFGSGVPAKLPRGILRERPDVAQAVSALLRSARIDGTPQLRMAQSLRAVEGWIEPLVGLPAADDPVAADSPELDELRTLLSRAEQEVARDLRRLAERAQEQALLARQADTTRLAYLAARDRLKTGALGEWQLLEQYQQWLVATERQAASGGELALAWLQLVASTGASEKVLLR